MNKTEHQQIFDRWLSEHSGILYKLVRVYAFNHHDQEDLLQEIAVQVWKSIPAFKADAKESTYIYQVALFAALAWERRDNRQTRSVEASVQVTDVNLVKPISSEDSRLTWLYEQIAAMNAVDRSLMLLLLDGYDYGEIANLLGLTESNVGTRLTRLKKKIAAKKTEEYTK